MSIQPFLQSVKDYCYRSQQATAFILSNLHDLRENTEIFEKTCRVALSTIQLFVLSYSEAASFSRLSFVLATTANMHDFFNFLKHPRWFFCPVTADIIDQNATLNLLHKYLQKKVTVPQNPPQKAGKALSDNLRECLKDLAKEALEFVLNKMSADGFSYRNTSDFKKALEMSLNKVKNNQKYQAVLASENAALGVVSLQEAKIIRLRHIPLFQKLGNISWIVTDFATIAVACRDWKIIDLAKWADRIGQYRGFQWVKSNRVDSLFFGLIMTSFALKLIESIRKLRDDHLSVQEKRQARWNIATSLAEAALFGAMCLNLIGKTQFKFADIQRFAIFTKSLGILSIVVQPKMKLFQKPVDVAAA